MNFRSYRPLRTRLRRFDDLDDPFRRANLIRRLSDFKPALRMHNHANPWVLFPYARDMLDWIREHGGWTGTASETLDRWETRRPS